jgi:hypothetical protein
MAGRSDIGRNLKNAQKKRDKDNENREKAAEKRQRQNEQRQREAEERIGSRKPALKTNRPTDEASEGNRYSYKPPKPAKKDEASEGNRYSYKPKKTTVDESSESKRFSYQPPERDRTSEAERFSYRPPEREDDDEDDKPREWREPTTPAPRVLYDLAPAPSARDAVRLTDEPVDRDSSDFDITSSAPSTITSPTLRDWRGPLQGPRTREEAEARGMGPYLPETASAVGAAMPPMADAIGWGAARLKPAIQGVRDWSNAQMRETTPGTIEAARYGLTADDAKVSDYQMRPGGWAEPFTDSAAWERTQENIRRRNEEFGGTGSGADVERQRRGEQLGSALGHLAMVGPTLFDPEKTWGDVGNRLVGAGMGGFNAATAGMFASRPTAAVAQGVGHLGDLIQAPTDYFASRESYKGAPLGAVAVAGPAATAWNLMAQAFGNAASGEGKGFNASKYYNDFVESYRTGTTPTFEQAQSGNEAELARNRQRAYLTSWADPRSVAKNFDNVTDRDKNANELIQHAQQAQQAADNATTQDERDFYAVQAAAAGAEAYRIKNAHPIELADEYTNRWAQLAAELFLPDATDFAGGVFSVLGLTPAARRLSKSVGMVSAPTTEVIKKLEGLALGPQTRAMVDAVPSRSAWQKVAQLVGTTGYSRAELAVRDTTHLVSTVLADVDTASDAKILLTNLIRDPASLVKGLPAALFQSEGLIGPTGRAADGLVRFGGMGMDSKRFQESLNVLRSIGDEFLANSRHLNKVDFMLGEFIPATLQGGYRRYGVATELGEAPFATAKTRTKTLAGGQAYVEYLDTQGNVVGKSDNLSLTEANKLASTVTKQAKKGQVNQPSALNELGSFVRGIYTPFYITTQPGTWMTNTIGAVSMAAGDGMFGFGRGADMDKTIEKIWGGLQPTSRSLEGVESTAGVFKEAGLNIYNNIPLVGPALKGLSNKYGQIDEWVGKRVAYQATQTAIRKIMPGVMKGFAPTLAKYGITDPKVIRQFANHMVETARSGDDIMKAATDFLNPRTSNFNLSDVNTLWPEVLPVGEQGSLAAFKKMVAAANPQTWEASVNKWADDAKVGWEHQFAEAPQPPQSWSNHVQEATGDAADIEQLARSATKRGASPEEAQVWAKQAAESLRGINEQIQTLTHLATTTPDPNVRHALYNLWGQITGRTDDVRALSNRLSDEVRGRTAGLGPETANPIWQEEFFQPMRQAWDERNKSVNELLQQGAEQIQSGTFVPNRDYWKKLEAAASQDEAALWDVMGQEPTSGRYDKRLGQSIAAGRAIVDKAVAETFAVAARFNTPGAFDAIVSAEHANQLAGSQVSRYLEELYEKLTRANKGQVQGSGFFPQRNEVWRQLRRYEVWNWRNAQKVIADQARANIPGATAASRAGGNALEDIVIPELPMTTAMPTREAGIAGVWRTPEGEQPVRVVRGSGQNFEGNPTYRVQLPDGSIVDANMDELLIRTNGAELRKLTDVDVMRQSRQAIDETEAALSRTDTKDITSARKDMRKAWNKDVSAKWKKAPALDTLANRYWDKKTGMVVLPDTIPGVEDIYGSVVAGRRINGQADIEALVQEYVDLLKQRGRQKGEEQRLRIRERDARTEYVSAANRTETIDKTTADRITQELNLGNMSNTPNLDAAYRAATTANNTVGAEPTDFGKAAAHSLQTIEQMRDYLLKHGQEILQPSGKVSEAGALGILNELRRTVLPAWDNVRFASAEYANQMRSFSLLDRTHKTRADELLGIYAPYSFFFTRTAKNSVERMLFEPHIWRRVAQYNDAMNDIREDAGDPERYKNNMKVEAGGQTYYLNINLTKYLPTIGSLLYNDFADPESANNSFSYALENAQSTGMPAYAHWDVLSQVAQGRGGEIRPLSYLPFGRIAGWAYPKITGKDASEGWRPEGYEYAIGRELELMAVEGIVTPEEAMMVQDIYEQQQSGAEPREEQKLLDPARLKEIQDIARERAANKGLVEGLTSFGTGITVKPYDTDERTTLEAGAQYREAGYDPQTNPYGSDRARDAVLGENPELKVRWGKGILFNAAAPRPGDSTMRPADSASIMMMEEEKTDIYARMNAALDTAIREQGRELDWDEVKAIRAPFKAEIDALETKYPNANYPEGSGDPTQHMNPTEIAQYELEGILAAANEKAGESATKPAEDAPQAEWDAYRDAKATWQQTQLDYIEEQIAAVLATQEGMAADPQYQPRATDAWRDEFVKMVRGQYAVELAQRWGNQYATDLQRAWEDTAILQGEMDAQWYAERDTRIQTEFGDKNLALWKQYGDLPKDSEEKKAFGRENPIVYRMNAYAYSPEAYESVEETFGETWQPVYDNYPDFPPAGSSDEAWKKFYDSERAYLKANPEAQALKLYVDGRWAPKGTPPEYRGSYGEDYQEAINLFGEDIFDVMRSVPDPNVAGWDAFYDYHEKHPEISQFKEWQKETQDMSIAEYQRLYPPEEEGTGLPEADPYTYTGDRPVGSGRQPLGGEGLMEYDPWVSVEPGVMGADRSTPLMTESRAGGGYDTPTPEEVLAAGTAEARAGGEESLVSDADAPDATLEPGKSRTGKTGDDYLETSESWAKMQTSRAKWAKNEAEWNDRKGRITADFGEEATAMWDAYFDLPKGDARKEYMKEHPEMKLYNVAAFNPEEYAQAKELFAQEDLMAWVHVPAWDGTEETDALRRKYYQENPTAFVVHSWMNGRPSERDDDKGYDEEKGESFFDFGKDYNLAIEKFGDDIWQVVARYKTLGDDKAIRAQFYDDNPNFEAWSDWWYGGLPELERTGRSYGKRSGEGYDSLGHRAYGSWGGGGGGGGYGGGGAYTPQVEMPYIQPQRMAGNLWDAPYVRQWRPDWLDAPRVPEIERRQLRQWR